MHGHRLALPDHRSTATGCAAGTWGPRCRSGPAKGVVVSVGLGTIGLTAPRWRSGLATSSGTPPPVPSIRTSPASRPASAGSRRRTPRDPGGSPSGSNAASAAATIRPLVVRSGARSRGRSRHEATVGSVREYANHALRRRREVGADPEREEGLGVRRRSPDQASWRSRVDVRPTDESTGGDEGTAEERRRTTRVNRDRGEGVRTTCPYPAARDRNGLGCSSCATASRSRSTPRPGSPCCSVLAGAARRHRAEGRLRPAGPVRVLHRAGRRRRTRGVRHAGRPASPAVP